MTNSKAQTIWQLVTTSTVILVIITGLVLLVNLIESQANNTYFNPLFGYAWLMFLTASLIWWCNEFTIEDLLTSEK